MYRVVYLHIELQSTATERFFSGLCNCSLVQNNTRMHAVAVRKRIMVQCTTALSALDT